MCTIFHPSLKHDHQNSHRDDFDATMLFNDYMMFHDVTSPFDLLTTNQLVSLLMPKLFWKWPPMSQGSFSIVHQISRWINLFGNRHCFI